MTVFTRIIDVMTRGSERPIRRLTAYYAGLAAVVAALLVVYPGVNRLLLGGRLAATQDLPRLLQDGLATAAPATVAFAFGSLFELALTVTLALIGTLALMLPVSWVYMSARRVPGHNQSVAQALIILPIVIAGVVFIVRDSLALALSLAGVVAAVRFRTNLRDARDTVFIFLAIAVGFSAGVQTLAIGALLTVVFNLVIVLTWWYDFGRNPLSPTATAQWHEPLSSLARKNGERAVPDRDLVLALTPANVDALADRFERVRDVVGSKKKPRYDALLSVTTEQVGETQQLVEKVLEKVTKRWKLDEIVTENARPSALYYLVRMRKSVPRDELITAIRARGGDRILAIDLEVGASGNGKRQRALS
jgi:hypothetical protein